MRWSRTIATGGDVARLLVLVTLGSALAGCFVFTRTRLPPGSSRPPTRVAAQDAALRALVADLAAPRLCEQLRGSFLPLPEDGAPDGARGGIAPAAGRLWIESCEARSTPEGQLDVTLRGRGWSWADESSGGLFSFHVRQYIPFRAAVRMVGVLDVAYTRQRRVVSIWLSPAGGGVGANLVPLTQIRAAPETVLATIAGIFVDADAQATEQAARDGSERFRQRLAHGLSISMDLCRGQMDRLVGRLGTGETPQRPFATGSLRFLENQRVRLHPRGIDVAGPWSATDGPLRIDVRVDAGGPVEVTTACASDAQRLVESYVAGQPRESADGGSGRTVTRSTALTVDPGACPTVLIARPIADADVVFSYRVTRTNDRPEALVDCTAP